ncbi:MAG: hypothetical protein ABL927_15020 [Bdellovibrionales bacterium]
MAKNEFLVSDDKNKVNVDSIFEFLTHLYWTKGRSRKTVVDSEDLESASGWMFRK